MKDVSEREGDYLMKKRDSFDEMVNFDAKNLAA